MVDHCSGDDGMPRFLPSFHSRLFLSSFYYLLSSLSCVACCLDQSCGDAGVPLPPDDAMHLFAALQPQPRSLPPSASSALSLPPVNIKAEPSSEQQQMESDEDQGNEDGEGSKEEVEEKQKAQAVLEIFRYAGHDHLSVAWFSSSLFSISFPHHSHSRFLA